MDLHLERSERQTDKRLFAERCATFVELIGLELALSHVAHPPRPKLYPLTPTSTRAAPSELRWSARLFGGSGTGPAPAWAARAGGVASLGFRALRFELAAGYDFPRWLALQRPSFGIPETATFGKGAGDEVCYFYAIHWPAGALRSPGVATIIHGANSCMDGL